MALGATKNVVTDFDDEYVNTLLNVKVEIEYKAELELDRTLYLCPYGQDKSTVVTQASHGVAAVSEKCGRAGARQEPEALTKAYVDRARLMVSRDKNRPSVVIWSLGNEAFQGRNFQAMYDCVKAYDDTWPVHYEEDVDARISVGTASSCPWWTFDLVRGWLVSLTKPGNDEKGETTSVQILHMGPALSIYPDQTDNDLTVGEN
ncbi:hypothetical protein Sste5346_009670 [Sporothrix stenoceras]|uniref:beta-galactosidase n=1 Tax=Sporothrix stenoceras TaxID=5173 RepID=A0ABR3YIY3_9PEZI